MPLLARFSPLPLLLALLCLSGCIPWAVRGQHQLKVVAPASVAPGAVFRFQVEIKDLDGQPLRNIHYGWLIDWPEVRGILHTGISFEPQEMMVKGGAGKAALRLHVHDEKGRTSQVDRFDFRVE